MSFGDGQVLPLWLRVYLYNIPCKIEGLINLPVCVFVCLSVCLLVCLSISYTLTLWVRMSECVESIYD